MIDGDLNTSSLILDPHSFVSISQWSSNKGVEHMISMVPSITKMFASNVLLLRTVVKELGAQGENLHMIWSKQQP